MNYFKTTKLKNKFMDELDKALKKLFESNPEKYKSIVPNLQIKIINVLICLETDDLLEFETRKKVLLDYLITKEDI